MKLRQKKSGPLRLVQAADRRVAPGEVLAWLGNDAERAWRLVVTGAGDRDVEVEALDPQDRSQFRMVLQLEEPTLEQIVRHPVFRVATQGLQERAHVGAEEGGQSVVRASAAVTSAAVTAPRGGRAALWMSGAALVFSMAAAAASVYAVFVSLAAASEGSAQVAAVSARPESDQTTAASDASSASGVAGLLGVRLDAQTLGPRGLEILQEAAARAGFSLNNDSKDLVVMFSDPECPACRQFDQWIAKDNYKTFAPLIVPVAFQRGSLEAAAGVLCSKDQAKAWMDVMAGKSLQPCEQGRRDIELNNAAFEALGFRSTPVFVAINGKILERSMAPAEMSRWAKQNTPAEALVMQTR